MIHVSNMMCVGKMELNQAINSEQTHHLCYMLYSVKYNNLTNFL
jgi:hypothetical protein